MDLVDTFLHATGEERVAVFEAVDERRGDEARTTVAEILEHQPLERDAVGYALPGEGLHDQLRGPHLVEAAVEAVLLAVARVDVAIGATRPAVEAINAELEIARWKVSRGSRIEGSLAQSARSRVVCVTSSG